MDVLVLTKKSEYQLALESPLEADRWVHHAPAQVQAEKKRAHHAQAETLDTVLSVIRGAGDHADIIYRGELMAHRSELGERDLLVAVGGDGTFIEAAHYADEVPVLGVNGDTLSSVGYYTFTDGRGFKDAYARLDSLVTTRLPRMRLALDSVELPERALNDVYVGRLPSTIRYEVDPGMNGDWTKRRDSGLLVCTLSGSTAWMWEEGGEAMPFDAEAMRAMLQYRPLGKRVRSSGFSPAVSIRSDSPGAMVHLDPLSASYRFEPGSVLELTLASPVVAYGDFSKKQKEFLARHRSG